MRPALLLSSALCAVLLMLSASPAGAQAASAKSPLIEKLPAVTEDKEIPEPDYAVVAADARE